MKGLYQLKFNISDGLQQQQQPARDPSSLLNQSLILLFIYVFIYFISFFIVSLHFLVTLAFPHSFLSLYLNTCHYLNCSSPLKRTAVREWWCSIDTVEVMNINIAIHEQCMHVRT